MKVISDNSKVIYKKQARVALGGLIAEVPNLVLTIILAFRANNILCWIDTVVSVSVVIHYLIVVAVSMKMAKENGDKYNYGLERLEVFTSFICDLIISLTMLVLLGSAIYGIVAPQKPDDSMLWFIILKSVNTAFDVYFLINGIMIVKKRKSRLNETELNNYLNNLIHDVLILIASVFSYIFRDKDASAYISSIVGIICIVYFLYTYIKHIRTLVKELSDASLSIKEQDYLLDVVLENNKGLKKIKGVNCHTLNGVVYVDIVVSFQYDITYENEQAFLKLAKEKIQDKHPKAMVRLVIEDDTKQIETIN